MSALKEKNKKNNQNEMKEKNEKKESIWSVPFIILMCVNFFSGMSSFMTSTTIPILASSLGAAVSMVGIIVGIWPLAALIVRPIAGPAFDSFSRKKLLIVVQIMGSACLFLYGITDSIPMLLAVRFAHGAFAGCTGPLAMSLVSEYLPRQKFASGISVYALSNSCAQVLGPAVGLYLVSSIGFTPSYFLAGSFLLVAMLGVCTIREPYHERLKYELKLNRIFAREAVGKAVALMLLSLSFSSIGSYVVLYGYEAGIQDMGFYFVVYAICLFATRPLFGFFADRVGSPKVILVGIFFFVFSFILLSQAHDEVEFAIAAVVSSAGFGSCSPLLQSMALGCVDIDRRGAASNTAFTGIDLGLLCGPVLGGLTVEFFVPFTGSELGAYSVMWLIMIVPTVCAFMVVAYWIYRKYKRKRARAERAKRDQTNE